MRAATLALAIAGAGCASVLSFEGVRPMKANALAVSLEPSAIGTTAYQGGNEQLYAAACVRYGVTDDITVGLRAGYNTRPELLARFQLLRPDQGLLSLALVPTLGALYTPDAFGDSVRAYSQSTVVLGIGDDWLVSPVMTVKLDVTGGVSLASGGESSSPTRAGKVAVALTPIATLGAVVRVTDWLALLPEIGGGFGSLYAGHGGPLLSQGAVYQAGLGVLIGGERGFSL
ncbi:MAG: hypothetical protein A2138_17165 [Deltaproteobacteria bacterium RBG_16_71_12]|nr:MAG: hypothetical protein A2138_17165 [Deltaproteobacteria bacterium RBG_16_71_12]